MRARPGGTARQHSAATVPGRAVPLTSAVVAVSAAVTAVGRSFCEHRFKEFDPYLRGPGTPALSATAAVP